jgi:hypothetical protein
MKSCMGSLLIMVGGIGSLSSLLWVLAGIGAGHGAFPLRVGTTSNICTACCRWRQT